MSIVDASNPLRQSESKLVGQSINDVSTSHGDTTAFSARINSFSSLEESNDTLLINEVLKDRFLTFIFICSGLCSHKYLAKGSFAYCSAYVAVPFSKVIAILSAVFYFQMMVVKFATNILSDLDDYLILVFCYLCLIAQCSLLVPISNLIHRRLEEQRISATEALHFTKAKTVFYQVLATMLFILPFYLIIAVATDYRSIFLPDVPFELTLYFPFYLISQTYVSLYLSAALIIFASDGMFTCSLLQELIDCANKQDLPLSDLYTVRTVIQRIYTPYSGITSSIGWMALVNVAAFLLRIYIDYKSWQSLFAAIGYYGKELPFALIMCYFSASVNDLADQLLLVLSKNEWRNDVKEMQRVKMYVLEAGEPISFYVFNRRIGKKQLMFEVVGLLGAILVAVIRVLIYATKFFN